MKLDFKKINFFRKNNGLSIMGLCQLTGISRTTLWKWENGKLIPSEKHIQKMCKVLNVSISEISDIEEPAPVSQKNLTDVVDSWLTLADLNSAGHQKEIGNILDSIKNLNNKLNQSVVIIKALLDTMETMFYIKDSRLKYLTANVSFLKNVSYDPENKVLGKDDFVFFSQEEARENTEEDRNVLHTGEPILRQERPLPGCRKTKWGIVSKLPVFDSENKIVGIIGTFIDITQRKKSEGNFRLIEQCLNSTSQIIIIVDGINNHFVYISKKSFEVISGYSAEVVFKEEVASILKKICHPDDIHKFYVVVNWPETYTCEWRMICADRKTRWIKMTVSHIWNDTNKTLHLIWTCVDITDEKDMEYQRIKYSNYLQNELLSFSPQILWTGKIAETVKSQFYKLTDINEKISHIEKNIIKKNQYITVVDLSKYLYITKESFENISGCSVDQLYGLSKQDALNSFCHSSDITKHTINVKWPETHTYEWRMVRPDNQIRWIRTTKTHVTNTSNQFLYSISLSIDITDLKNNIGQVVKAKQFMQNKILKLLMKYLWPYSELKQNLSFIHLSDEIELLTGFSKSIFTQNERPIQSVIHSDYIEDFNSLLKMPQVPANFEFKIVTSEDKIIDMKTSVSSKKTEDGEMLYYGKAEQL